MALQIEYYYFIIAAGIILGVFPVLGRFLYVLKNKVGRLLSIYFIGSAGFFAFNMLLSDYDLNLKYTIDIVSQLNEIKIVYVLSLILYFLGGFGLFGSVAEKSVEVLEDINLLSTLERRKSLLRRYFMNTLYGYVFTFSVYALARILLIILGVTYKYGWQEKVYTAMGFESPLLVLVGTSLFLLKSFNYGIFSRGGYWKSLSHAETEDTARSIFRKLIIIFLFVWAVYISFILFFVHFFRLETSLFTATPLDYDYTKRILHSLQLVFYITTTIQTLYFLTHIYKLVSSLKSVDPNFKKKIDESIKIEEDQDDDIKF